eukprot:m.19756 g.19756  ORF g.19756 m.19756 type:complete len:347 (-) comp8535_c0_seq1:664-1704(-)
MGCGDSDAKKRAAEIQRLLRKDFFNNKRELKLLLLGTGESGKSTIIKQMRILYGEGFAEEDRKGFTMLVYRNILTSMKAMLDALDKFGMKLADPSLQSPAYELLDIDTNTYSDIQRHKGLFQKLWADNSIQAVHKRRNEYQLSDSTSYFLNDVPRIGQPGFIPSVDDVLRAREATTGIHEYIFELNKAVFRMLDVGGQRSERRKWIHCFENITSIIFIVACSEYDQTLVEQTDMNRMRESIALFEQIITYDWFRETSFILFLNKQDLLEMKVATSHLRTYFPAFKGPDRNYEAAKEFILQMYMERNPEGHDVYPHFTHATDTNNIEFVFNAVKSTILKIHLKDYGF